MKRRDFIAIVGGSVFAPFILRAQQPDHARKLAALAALQQMLGGLGWKQGDNLRIDDHWSAGSQEGARAVAQQIAASKPDVIVGQSLAVIEALLSTTRSTPIVFVHVADPVASGLVSNLARPEGNVTGITNIVPSIGAKWLQLLKEIAPAVTQAALLVNPDTSPDRGAIFLNPFEAAARSLGVTSVKGEVHDLNRIKLLMASLATESRGGVVVIPDAFFASHSTEIVELAERFKLPAVYPYRYYVEQGWAPELRGQQC
jgi:ABC-type uncharacterized transport system substrate-binding protein